MGGERLERENREVSERKGERRRSLAGISQLHTWRWYFPHTSLSHVASHGNDVNHHACPCLCLFFNRHSYFSIFFLGKFYDGVVGVAHCTHINDGSHMNPTCEVHHLCECRGRRPQHHLRIFSSFPPDDGNRHPLLTG